MKRVFTSAVLTCLAVFILQCCSPTPPGYIIFCAGDSITEADYPRFLNRMLREEGIRAKVFNFGRSGHNSGEYLVFLEQNLDRLRDTRPDFVLLQLGTNDVRIDGDHTPAPIFEGNMKAIIDLFRTFRSRSGREPHILIATIPPIPEGSPYPFSPESVARVQAEINPIIRRIAEEEGIPLVDNYGLFAGRPDLLPEVHPTLEGYRHLALNWFEALKPFFSTRSSG